MIQGTGVDDSVQEQANFFISRAGKHSADVAMASKIGQIFEKAGHRVYLQHWDFANRNFKERMDAALASGARVIAILTPEYLASDYCDAEWMHALNGDPLNKSARLIIFRCAECAPRGLLRTIAYWDLVSVADQDDFLADIYTGRQESTQLYRLDEASGRQLKKEAHLQSLAVGSGAGVCQYRHQQETESIESKREKKGAKPMAALSSCAQH